MNVWDADIEVTEELAKGLIRSQFPDLSPLRMSPFGEGWDNAAFLVNDEFVFRFPRRSRWAWTLANECRVLPILASRLPQPIPVPIYIGAPEPHYPCDFAGYRILPGMTACRLAWTDPQRAANAESLGRFLAALHSIPIDEETREWAPKDSIDRADMKKRAPIIIDRVRNLPYWPIDTERESVCALVERLSETPPWDNPPVWVHGDLYARHLVMTEHGRLAGVIDWGDVHLGDPALDLSIAFSFLPTTCRELFRKAYGPIDGATWDRARFRAIHYGPPLITYGLDIGDDAIRAAGEYALKAAIDR